MLEFFDKGYIATQINISVFLVLLKAAVLTVGTGVTAAAVNFFLAVGAHVTGRAAA